MSRRSVLVAFGVFVLLVATLVGGLWLLVRYEPRFYSNLLTMDDDDRYKASQEFLTEITPILAALMGGEERGWHGRFTDRQVNGYFAEGFIRQGFDKSLRDRGFSEPRIVFEEDRIRLAVRYKKGFVNTVITMCLRVWVPASEPNALAIQLECLKSGLVPFSAQWLLEQAVEPVRQHGNEVTWYRHQGLPVALVRFQADRPRPSLQLKSIQIEQGVLTVNGQSVAAVGRPPRSIALKR